jgi:hypothetical protein
MESPPLPSSIEQLQALVAQLQKQLKAAGVDPDAALLSLDDIKANLQKATAKLMEGDETVQPEFDKWERIMSSHPEHIEQQERADTKWENDQRPINNVALQKLRSLFPKDLSTCNKKDLAAKCGETLATRITRKAALRMITMDTTLIAKLHAADLVCKFAFNGLDLRETRALYAAMPPNGFQNDGDGRKAEWGYRLREKLKGMTAKETANGLRDDELIARDYSDTKALPRRARRSTLASGSNEKRGKPTKKGGRRGSIASMLEGKIGPGKGNGKGSHGQKNKGNNPLALLFAGRGSPNSPSPSVSPEEKVSSSEGGKNSAGAHLEVLLNRRRFSAGKDSKVAWRASSSVHKQKRSQEGRQVMKLASAFKQAQSALNQLMSSKEETKTKTKMKMKRKTTIQTQSTQQQVRHNVQTNDPRSTESTVDAVTVDTTTVAKSRKVVNELEQLLGKGQRQRKNKTKRKLSMGEEPLAAVVASSFSAGAATTGKAYQSHRLCRVLKWLLAAVLVLFAIVGLAVVGYGILIDDGSHVVVPKASLVQSNVQKRRRKRRRKTDGQDDAFSAKEKNTEGAFTFEATDTAAGRVAKDQTLENLFPITSSKKESKCSGKGMKKGCVYTATTTGEFGGAKNVNDQEGLNQVAAAASPKPRPPEVRHDGSTMQYQNKKKKSSYRQWQLRKKREEEGAKRRETELSQKSLSEDAEGEAPQSE